MYIIIYTYVYTYIHTHTYINAYIHIHTCTNTHTHIHTHTHIGTIHTYIHVHTYMNTYIRTEEGRVFSWGSNDWGQLGITDFEEENLQRPDGKYYRYYAVLLVCDVCV